MTGDAEGVAPAVRFEADESALNYRELRLLAYLRREYTLHIAMQVLRPIIVKECPVSLRALDWAVVNWAKRHRVVCPSTQPGEMTSIHQSYRTSLSFWRRRLFDPFRRRGRIELVLGDERLHTTLGQAIGRSGATGRGRSRTSCGTSTRSRRT